jgi:hypothetical protein
MIIIDNFLPESYFKELKTIMFGSNFPWNFNGSTTPGFDNDIYFTHMGFKRELNNSDNPFNSPFYFDSKAILYFIEEKFKFHIDTLYRINCTMVIIQPERSVSAFHVDYTIPHYTGILYMNNCNGPTVFDNKEEVEFKENRFVLFDGSRLHAASQQNDVARRVNIVFNFSGRFK